MTKIKNREGFTIVELMIALTITGVILAAVYGIYAAFYKTSGSQDLLTEAQQNARAGISVIEADLINAGLNAGTSDVFTEAENDEIKFIFKDPRNSSTRVKVKYEFDDNTLKRKYSICGGAEGNNNSVINNVSNLEFTYYKGDGSCVNGSLPNCNEPSGQSERNNIRLVKISLQTKTSSKLPIKNDYGYVTLETWVYLRNMDVRSGSSGC